MKFFVDLFWTKKVPQASQKKMMEKVGPYKMKKREPIIGVISLETLMALFFLFN